MNIQTHYFDLHKAHVQGQPEWQVGLDFNGFFHLGYPSPDNMGKAAEMIVRDSLVASRYAHMRYAQSKITEGLSCGRSCQLNLYCMLTSTTYFMLQDCKGEKRYKLLTSPHYAIANWYTRFWIYEQPLQ